MIKKTIAAVKSKKFNWEQLLAVTKDYSAAQIVRGCRNTMKTAVLKSQETVTSKSLVSALQESGEKTTWL
ncbi:MAG: hypothetical protein WA125_14080 [Desulfosporosinus sp.]